jgi:hypothetical protein
MAHVTLYIYEALDNRTEEVIRIAWTSLFVESKEFWRWCMTHTQITEFVDFVRRLEF